MSKVFAIGGSAGSLDIVLKIAESIPAESKNIYIVIVHRKSSPDSVFEDLIAARSPLPVSEVEDKDPVEPGHIYIAPPGYHLLFEAEDLFSLDGSEKLHFSRPSIDITFESAAETFGHRVTGILLSGANADGAAGLCTIKKHGGTTITQDPESAEVGYMPRQAIDRDCAMKVLSPEQISAFIRSES